MRILNVRHGFACNSSSSHSVVFFDPVTRPRFDHHKADDFGWGNFTLASKEAKRRYAFSAVMTAASSIIRARMEANGNPHPGWELNDTKRLAWEAEERRLMFEVLKHYGWTEDTVPPYTDHQSVLTVPSTFDGHGLLTPFVERFIKFFERDDVTVLGGNDNDYSVTQLGDSLTQYDTYVDFAGRYTRCPLGETKLCQLDGAGGFTEDLPEGQVLLPGVLHAYRASRSDLAGYVPPRGRRDHDCDDHEHHRR